MRSGREHLAWILAVEVRQGTLGVDGRGWGPAGNTGRGWSWLRSGREHWAWMVVVEVRQGTLGVDGRGWGPAGNTGRGWSWLRSGREHWAWMVVVEVRQRTLWIASRSWAGGRGGQREEEDNERRRRGEEEEEDQATDIKSNNPHLAGGEKQNLRQKKQKTSLHPIKLQLQFWNWYTDVYSSCPLHGPVISLYFLMISLTWPGCTHGPISWTVATSQRAAVWRS